MTAERYDPRLDPDLDDELRPEASEPVRAWVPMRR